MGLGSYVAAAAVALVGAFAVFVIITLAPKDGTDWDAVCGRDGRVPYSSANLKVICQDPVTGALYAPSRNH